MCQQAVFLVFGERFFQCMKEIQGSALLMAGVFYGVLSQYMLYFKFVSYVVVPLFSSFSRNMWELNVDAFVLRVRLSFCI